MSRLYAPVTGRDHVRGAARALVTLVEYGDYQCPQCGRAFWILRDIEDRFHRDLRFVYRHFPLTEIHPLAMVAAEAAEAAAAQENFWEMHEMLFQNQPDFEPEVLVACATALDLDVEAFAEDLATHRHQARIREDFMSGVRSGVNGTPCLFLNGERYDGLVEEGLLARAIDGLRRRRYAEAGQ